MGAVLAGGEGRRLGGDKAVAMLAGRPLITYALAALAAVVADVTIIAKPGTVLPPAAQLGGARVIHEPAEPRHPLVGIVAALEAAGDRSVLICAADMPFLTPAALSALADADPGNAPAVVAAQGAALQPLLGCYQPQAAALLADAARQATAPVRAAVAAIGPRVLHLPGGDQLLDNVNSPADLQAAEARLISRT